MKASTPTFTFGKNWRNYLAKINSEHINDAKKSLQNMLGKDNLNSLRFLDAGCGSGLFSLSALKLGASEVLSFDVDKDSTKCAHLLNEKFGPFENWSITEGNILDINWLKKIGKFDVVYSWGVLHHTGDMWSAFENITSTIQDNGLLFISIYNDQGLISRIWVGIKKLYNNSISPIKVFIACGYFSVVVFNRTITGLFNAKPFSDWYKGSERGMNLWHDTVDWVGGYPFETASVKEIETFFIKHKFELINSKPKKGSGCNEFVFKKLPEKCINT